MSIEAIWFVIIVCMFTLYVVLDGFDLGTAIIYPFVARNEEERQTILRSIGMVWDGNEVWLIAAGGALFCAFPMVYAISFSGFYLPLMMVLWLLIFRGLAIELRHHLNDPVWRTLWGGLFVLSSSLLAIFFGAALGNIIRGVPMDDSHKFFEPLFTDFRINGAIGILDWYTILVGLNAYLALGLHGASWTILKTEGEISNRAYALARTIWWAVGFVTLIVTLSTFLVQPQAPINLKIRPWGIFFPVLAFCSFGMLRYFLSTRQNHHEKWAFLSSSFFLAGMMANGFYGIFPNILPARIPENSLTIQNAATDAYGLKIALCWWIPGIILAIGYFIFLYTRLPRKFTVE